MADRPFQMTLAWRQATRLVRGRGRVDVTTKIGKDTPVIQLAHHKSHLNALATPVVRLTLVERKN